jgi:transposase InsO family protein
MSRLQHLRGRFIPFIWAVGAFRPDEVSAETTRVINDFGWFSFLFTCNSPQRAPTNCGAPTSPNTRTRDEKVYCRASLDCFSPKIVARTFSTTPDTALVDNAVNMAVANRNRCGSTIVHADHGTQFTSWSFSENVRRWGCSPPSAPSATAMTTPPWNPSGPDCKSSYSTPANGQPP